MESYRISKSVLASAQRTGRLDLHKAGLERLPTEVLQHGAAITILDLSEVRYTIHPLHFDRFMIDWLMTLAIIESYHILTS